MRRGFGRPIRPFRRAFAPDAPPLLQRANQLLSSGNYAEAANAFEQLARAAEARGGPRAPFFYVQAGRGKVQAGKTADGLEDLERGLGLFATRGKADKASKVGLRIISELNARGLRGEAQKIRDYLRELVPGFEEGMASSSQSPAPQRRTLPPHCPGCGAPLLPDEVEWQEGGTAVCEYCGSPVHGE